jgi:hypothetical protein
MRECFCGHLEHEHSRESDESNKACSICSCDIWMCDDCGGEGLCEIGAVAPGATKTSS